MNLHSIMFILKQILWEMKDVLIAVFTFHYVYIKFLHFQPLFSLYSHLYSTIFILKLIYYKTIAASFLLFTFHDVYIKTIIPIGLLEDRLS